MLFRLAHLGVTNALALLRLLVRPETILRWHHDLIRRRHAARIYCLVAGAKLVIWSTSCP